MTQEELLEIKKQRKIEADELLLKKIALKAKDISELIKFEYPELKFRVADCSDFKGIFYEFTPKKKHKILFWEVWL